jgi:type IV pilus assembly protein PilC
MASFTCKIGTDDGRVVEKEFEASSRQLLRASLTEQGFYVFSIRRRLLDSIPGLQGAKSNFTGRRFLSFNQELIVLLRSGLPILQVLDTITERLESGQMFDVLRSIREDIRGGDSLSEAFGKFPNIFPHLYIASIKAGERTGDLPITLTRYVAYQKRVESIRAKVKQAAFYPLLLTITVFAVILFLMFFVVPRFTQVYADAHVELPLVTRILVATASGLGNSLPLLLPALLVLIVLTPMFLRTERGTIMLDRAKLQIPFVGNLLTEYSLLSFCRTLGTTLSSGIPIVQALRMSRATLNNRIYEARMIVATRKVEEGSSFADSLEQTGFFTNIALRMIAVGETSGSLPDMLMDVADYYESEVEFRLDRLTSLIEPAMMVGMGLLIGGIVVSMYLPIFKLAETVG